MPHSHPAEFLSAQRPPDKQALERTSKVAREIVAALEGEMVHAANFSCTAEAPPGHPDRFPHGDGVRKDNRRVLMVVIEVDAHPSAE